MWTVRLSSQQCEALQLLLRAQGKLGPSLAGTLESLELARWDELPEAELPWERVAALAKLQGIGEADVVWDLAAGLPAPPSSRRPARERAPAPKRTA